MRTVLNILQTETIYIDEEIIEGGTKYYIDKNGNKQHLLPSPSDIRQNITTMNNYSETPYLILKEK